MKKIEQGPPVVDSVSLYCRTEAARFERARDCPHLAIDRHETPCLWHRSFCRHPETPSPEKTGQYETCKMVWLGSCPFEVVS